MITEVERNRSNNSDVRVERNRYYGSGRQKSDIMVAVDRNQILYYGSGRQKSDTGWIKFNEMASLLPYLSLSQQLGQPTWVCHSSWAGLPGYVTVAGLAYLGMSQQLGWPTWVCRSSWAGLPKYVTVAELVYLSMSQQLGWPTWVYHSSWAGLPGYITVAGLARGVHIAVWNVLPLRVPAKVS